MIYHPSLVKIKPICTTILCDYSNNDHYTMSEVAYSKYLEASHPYCPTFCHVTIVVNIGTKVKDEG